MCMNFISHNDIDMYINFISEIQIFFQNFILSDQKKYITYN